VTQAYATLIITNKGLLSKPTTAAEPCSGERVFMPHTCRSQYPSGSAQLAGNPTVGLLTATLQLLGGLWPSQILTGPPWII
jgi:hypothetical protein